MIQEWHPPARFQTVAIDVLEISPEAGSAMRKVVVIGDLFSRFMQAIPTRDETAETISWVLFERWIGVFGPPDRFLIDQGKVFVSAIQKRLCERMGIEKSFLLTIILRQMASLEDSTAPSAMT